MFAQIDNASHVAVASENYWPLPWYYRGVLGNKLAYYGKKVDEDTIYSNNFDLVITYDADTYPYLNGYTERTIKLNYWFSYYDNQDRLLERYFERNGKMGSMNLDIFTRVRPNGSSSGI